MNTFTPDDLPRLDTLHEAVGLGQEWQASEQRRNILASTQTTMGAILRRRREYGRVHFQVGRKVPENLEEQTASHPMFGESLGSVLGIPVVVDHSLPAYRWVLVDSSSGRVLHFGELGEGNEQ